MVENRVVECIGLNRPRILIQMPVHPLPLYLVSFHGKSKPSNITNHLRQAFTVSSQCTYQ